ncbi:hypothetical protein GCM10017750_62460 [Streptomyces racemochromogenes]
MGAEADDVRRPVAGGPQREPGVLLGRGPRDHTIAERSKNYRYSTNHQVVIDADTRRVVVVGRPLAGNRNDCKA